MTPDLLDRAGTALYGPHFKPKLAEKLDVSLVTVQRWCSGREVPPDGVRQELLLLVTGRRKELFELEAELAFPEV